MLHLAQWVIACGSQEVLSSIVVECGAARGAKRATTEGGTCRASNTTDDGSTDGSMAEEVSRN